MIFLAYIDYLLDQFPSLIQESIEENNTFMSEIRKSMKSLTDSVRVLPIKDCSELLVGKCDLSQRSYNSLKKLLKSSNVKLKSYEEARNFANQLEVGDIEYDKHLDDTKCPIPCMHASTDLVETLKLICSTEELFKEFSFPERENQRNLFSHLQTQNSELYKNLDSDKRTVFIRDTGDNFRASKHYPTEQISFSVLNLQNLINSPYGQFATSLFRGPENRTSLKSHGQIHFNQLKCLATNGLLMQLPDTSFEHFNVVVFLVADLGYIKEVIGKSSCMSMYGCYQCCKPINEWHSKDKKIAKLQTVSNYTLLGKKAEAHLGENPEKDSTKYKEFVKKNLSQWVSIIL